MNSIEETHQLRHRRCSSLPLKLEGKKAKSEVEFGPKKKKKKKKRVVEIRLLDDCKTYLHRPVSPFQPSPKQQHSRCRSSSVPVRMRCELEPCKGQKSRGGGGSDRLMAAAALDELFFYCSALNLSLPPPLFSAHHLSPIPLSITHSSLLTTDRTLTLELGADATVAAVKAAVEAKQGEFQFFAVLTRGAQAAIERNRRGNFALVFLRSFPFLRAVSCLRCRIEPGALSWCKRRETV